MFATTILNLINKKIKETENTEELAKLIKIKEDISQKIERQTQYTREGCNKK